MSNCCNIRLSRVALVTITCLILTLGAEAFLSTRSAINVCLTRLRLSSSEPAVQEPADMRLREIQAELKQRKVSFDDCFDRDSLTKRLIEAREMNPIKTTDETINESAEEEATSSFSGGAKKESTDDVSSGTFNREATLAELRTQRIKSLREQLSQYNVRWGNMIEKEELVKALCDAMEERYMKSQNFSRSGEVVVGEVLDANEDVLMKELGWLESDLSKGVKTLAPDDSNPASHAPLLLDVYATWCGPCQFMVPHFKDAAKELGPDARVIKLDSDKYPRIASVLKVGGLPSVILFDGGDICKEVERIEGALTKDQLIGLVKKHF